ncbi:SMR family transporter [Paeniglutamicibacter sp.]|uniref:SMR family transporter n=1 Tax=Paeniglutamicibacter sp. TaxID=1934391 RepID=UPI00398A10F6
MALGAAEGFTKLVPTVAFAAGPITSLAGLAWAMKEIATGSAYAVGWESGAGIAVPDGMAFGG